MVEYSKRQRAPNRRTVTFQGRSVVLDTLDLREIGAPEWLAKKVEQRQAKQITDAEFRAQARKRLAVAMSGDEDAMRRLRCERQAEEIADEDITDLDEDERNLVRAFRQLRKTRKALTAKHVS